MTSELKFSVNKLIVDDTNPSIAHFNLIEESFFEKSCIKLNDDKEEEILSIKKCKKTIYKNRYVCLYFEEGDKYPYPEKVIDSNLGETPNPRPKEQIELIGQFFVLIDTNTSRIYISDQRKKMLLVEWIQKKIIREVCIKPLISQEEFVQNITSLNEVSFTLEPNLLNSNSSGSLSTELVKNIYGFGAQEAILNLNYKNSRITQNIQNKLNQIIGKKDEYKKITITGRTNDNFESIFDMNNIVSKISVNIDVDNNHKINEETVFNTIISKIE